MMTVICAVKDSVRQHLAPLLDGEPVTIYVACSGGRDSMALLFACHQLALPIEVVHINHQLQAPSLQWQSLVESFCREHGIACTAIAIDWQTYGLDPADVNEQYARQARYQAIANYVPAGAIVAVAHHSDDQAETILLNLCHGAGIDGLCGMQPLSHQQEFGKPLQLWRPLLGVSRETITDFVQLHAIAYVDDPTNDLNRDLNHDLNHQLINIGKHNQRAWLRQAVMPKLKLQFPALLDGIGRSAKNLADAKQILDAQSEHDLQICRLSSGWTPAQKRLDIRRLNSLGHPRAMAALRQWIKGQEKFAPSRQLVEQVYRLSQLTDLNQQMVIQWQGIKLRRHQQTLYRLDKDYDLINTALADRDRVIAQLQPPFSQFKQHFLDNMCMNKMHTANVGASSLTIRPVMPNEKLQRLGKPYHEPFKKLCQREHIPSWERCWAWVVVLVDAKTESKRDIAVMLPSQSYWLTGVTSLAIPPDQPCPFVLSIA